MLVLKGSRLSRKVPGSKRHICDTFKFCRSASDVSALELYSCRYYCLDLALLSNLTSRSGVGKL